MPRRYEVNEEDCIGCSLCSERAPDNLEVPTGARMARVYKQPETPAEEAACREAADFCPAGALEERIPAAPPASRAQATATHAPAGDATPADHATLPMEN